MEKRKMKRNSKKNHIVKRIILGSIGTGIILFSALGAYSLSVNGAVKEWDDKIYPGVGVQNVYLGGMNKSEAIDKLIETLQDQIEKKVLTINAGDKKYELSYSDINPKYNIQDAVEKAYDFGRNDNNIIKYKMIKSQQELKDNLGIEFSYDENKLNEFEKKIQDEVMEKPKDASIKIDGSKISIEDETDGQEVDLDTLDNDLKKAINGNIDSSDSVNIDLEKSKPKITKEDLSKIKGVISSFSSNYGTSPEGRSKNIEIATKAINGTIVMPGEVFSFNDVVGDRTAERGYQEAGTYVGNKVEPGIGGGICQVSTTIYRAAMKANLRSVQRTNHSMAVGYAKPGLDATVAYGYLDYQFKNTYDFPIYIQGTTEGKVVTYNIYGDPSELSGKTYDMTNEVIETLQPETKTIEDNTLPVGQEVNEGGGMIGYKAKSYQITYENGKEVNRELVSTDTYAKVDNIIKKGTKVEVSSPDTNTTEAQAQAQANDTTTVQASEQQAPEISQ